MAAPMETHDLEFIRWLASRIKVAATVLDDIEASQVFYHQGEEVTRKVVREGLIHVIREDSTRICSDVAQALRKLRPLKAPPAGPGATNDASRLRAVRKGSA